MASAPATRPAGLTDAEVDRRRGATRVRGAGTGRTYWAIARSNVFTFFNQVLFVIGVALVALGEVTDAVMSVGLGLVNAAIGAVQEARAKRKLDRIALLTKPTVTVVRAGREQSVGPDELVMGDVVRVAAGDQLVVDGRLLGDGRLEVDESLLTGEADLVVKAEGDRVREGRDVDDVRLEETDAARVTRDFTGEQGAAHGHRAGSG